MANAQDSPESGVVSYGEPNQAALGSLASSASSPSQPTASYGSVEDLLGGTQAPANTSSTLPKQYGSVDDFLKEQAPKPHGVMVSNIQGAAKNIGQTLDAFKGGAYQAETQELGLSQDTQDWLRKEGIYNDYVKGEQNFGKSLNEALLNRLAAGADMAMRIPSALAEGTAAALETSDSQGVNALARDVRLAPNLLMEHYTLPSPVARARANGVIGEGEPGFMGTKAPTPEQAQTREIAAEQIVPETSPSDIHATARAIAPETFNEYDALAEQRETLGNQMRETSASRQQETEASAPHTQEIAELQKRLESEDLTERKTQRLQERMDDLKAKNQDFIEQEMAKVSPDIENIRQSYEAVDSRMRDLSPEVSAAYRSAAERIPQTETIDPESAQPDMPSDKVEQTPENAQPKAPAEPQSPQPVPLPDQVAHITADVAHQLTEAGRPQDEAALAAQLVAEHYKTRSERFGGKNGTAQEMYERDGANIKGGAAKAAKGKIRTATNNAKATITLMKSANASTFIHETGHHWLNELLHDSEDDRAPAGLVRDAATVRKWLGAEVGDIATSQHEKFARGFERYLMEGTAPSRTLASVFSQFKQWLSKIYQSVAKLRSPITSDIRAVFDRLLATNPEKTVIAPEREIGGLFAEKKEVPAPVAPEPPVSKEPPPQQLGGKKSPVMQSVPRRPLTLMDWVKKNGGVKDDGGDLAAAFGKDAKGIIRKNGMSLDDMALKAHEHGYFDEKGAERPTINDFINKLIQDRQTRDQYSAHDQGAVDAYNDAIQRNSEADRMAHDLGIDIAGKTHDQFWNEVREKMSVAEQAKEAQSLEEAQNAIAEEQEKKDKEYLESRGDSWEPAPDKTQTLEELENEYRSENAAAKPSKGGGGDEQSRLATGQPGQLETGEGQGNGGVGAGPESTSEPISGNARGPIAPEKPKSDDPASISGKPESVIDRNGNPRYDLIKKRIEKINTPDDVDNFIRQAARDNDAFSDARRGAVSHAQTFAMAEAMGVDGNFYDMVKTRKMGEAYNAHQLKAAEALFKALSVDAYNKSILEKTPENMAAFEAANQKFLMATSHFLGAASEAGRALNILRTMATGLKEAQDVQEFFQRNTGKTANDISKQMDFMSKLDNPANQAAFIQASKKATFRDMMLEYYVNCLLSGPFTHMRYMVGNAIKAIETPLVEIPLAAAHGAIREMLGKEPVGERVYLREASAQLYALGRGSADGLRAASTAWKTGQSPFLPGEIVRSSGANAIPGKIGDFINVPSSAIEAIHAFSKTVRYTQNIAGLATRTALREGMEGDAFDRRVAELTKAPTEPMMESATKDALKELYMAPADYNGVSGGLVRVTNSNMLAKIVVPFMKIGTQITREAFIERSPLGPLLSSDVRDNLAGRNGGAAKDMQVGKILTGTALMGTVATAVLSGNATGDGPSNPKIRAQWLLTHRPNTMTIGNLTIPYQGLGSLGMLMRFSANMTETAQHWDEEEGGKLSYSFLAGISKSILDDNWMRGLHDMLDAWYDEDKGKRYLQNMASNWLPFSVGMGQVAREVDPDQRIVRIHGMEDGFGLLDAIRSRIPIESETLLPRRDAFGQPIPNDPNKKYVNDPVIASMDALRIFPSQLERKIRGVKLTDQQYDDYSRIAGSTMKMRLNQIVQQPGFDRLPAVSQIEMINETIKIYREKARSAILMQYPEIMQKAMAAKRHDATGQ